MELLSVIAVIAVLLFLALPAIQRTRSQAKAVACVSHLRQLGQGVLSYAAEHRGSLPPILSYGITVGDPCQKLLLPYVNEERAIWDCPARPKLKTVGFTGYVQGNYLTAFYFGHPQSGQVPYTLARISEVPFPERRWLLADMDAWNYANNLITSIAPEPPHSGGRNVLYPDGGVRWVKSTRNVWP